MTHFVQTSVGLLEILAEYPEKQPLEDGTFRSVMMVHVRDARGHVTIMPASHLEILSRNPVGGSGQTGTGELEWTPDLGLMKKGAKDLHMLPETVGSLYKKPKEEPKEES